MKDSLLFYVYPSAKAGKKADKKPENNPERVAAALAQLARDVGVVGCEVAAKLPAGTNGVITVDDFVESARFAGIKRGMGKAAVELLLVLSRRYLQKQFGARSMLSHAEAKKAFAPQPPQERGAL